jgi:hypothetical protein
MGKLGLGEWGSAKGKLLERSFPLDSFQELSKRYVQSP